jgi:hypothetical protein
MPIFSLEAVQDACDASAKAWEKLIGCKEAPHPPARSQKKKLAIGSRFSIRKHFLIPGLVGKVFLTYNR